MPEVVDRFAAAQALHQAGRLEEAEQGYRQVLTTDPRHAAAWRMLGILARDSGRPREAIVFLEEGLHAAGPDAKLYFHLGQAYAAAGDAVAAIRSHRLSLTVTEANAKGHLALGQLLLTRGERLAAIEHFERAVELEPDSVDARFSLAVALAEDDQTAAAERTYRELLERAPQHAAAAVNLAAIVQDQGRLDEAIEGYRRALAADPRSWKAEFNLGLALGAKRDFAAAAVAFQRAVDLQPDVLDAHVRLGEVLAGCGQSERAQDCLRRALAAAPDRLLSALRVECIGERIFADNAEIDTFRRRLADRLTALAENGPAGGWQMPLAEMPVAGSQPPTPLIYQGRDDKPLKQQFARLLAGRLPRAELRRRTGKPRVGFVVTPEHEGIFLRGMAGVLNHLDPARLQATLVCGTGAQNRVASLVTSVDVQRALLPNKFAAAVEMLRAAEFDLLYFWEVGTDATNYYLPLARAAPVQCTSWGWPVTSGMDAIDYFVSSDMVEPAGAEAHYTEKLVRLRRLPLFYARPDMSAVAADRDRFGFGDSEHIYFCAQNPRKFHPDFDAMIRGILEADPQGVLVLVEATPAFLTEQLRGRFQRTLGDTLPRVRFLPRVTKGEFLQLIASADVVLDTPHYGGGANTTYETLALGKPLVTLTGEFHRGRYASGVLARIGLDDFVTATPDAYIRLAVALGGDAAWRGQWSHKISRSAAMMFEDRGAVGELEDWFLSAIARSREANA
ncbi:MAG TPA: tetratricopeptide repeat protein [Pirellulales bacterium]|jgi:predicted O-linked N-acetylglucosamine transferase (SPINDLY family)|nr:tetratricopeptide repeat protein [Pirellulales bacterium]